jgi:Tfp pilus assembly protein PilZ
VELECELYCELWNEAIAYRVTDVSEAGLWIQTDLLLEIGTEVTLTFVPPDWDEPLCVAGRVERVQLRSRSEDRESVGMGIEFEALRNDERRRLTHSMRCLRAEESFILGQRTLTGIPVGVADAAEHSPVRPSRQTLTGWPATAKPPPQHSGRPSRITASPAERNESGPTPTHAFPGGLDLAASVFSREPSK